MGIRLKSVTRGKTTVAVGEGRGGLTPKQVLMRELPADDPVLGLVDDDCFIDTSCREVKLEGSAERPEGKAEIRTMDGRNGRFTIESICTHYGKAYASYWVRLLDGPWPTPDDLVTLCDAVNGPDGTLIPMLNFGGTVGRVTPTIAQVRVAVD